MICQAEGAADNDDRHSRSTGQSARDKRPPSNALIKLAGKITHMDSFLHEHASTEQAYQIVNFIISHLERIERPRIDKKRYYKSLLTTKGHMLTALLNHTVKKLLSGVR